MPYRRKDSPIWWVSYTDANGKRVRRSTGTSNRKEADALEAKWKLQAFRVRQWDEEPSHSFDELLLGYLKNTQSEKRSAERDRYIARHLRSFFEERELESFNAFDVRAYIESRKATGTSPSTINRELAMLSSVITYARREWEWNIPNPVIGRKLRQPEGRVRWISREEAAVLITAAESEPKAPHLADFIRLALHTGCRKQELLGLEWTRTDLQRRLLFLEAEHTKTARRRTVPINAVAREVIANRLQFRVQNCPSSPWVFAHKNGARIKDVKRGFATACRRAEIADFRIHDLRHTCAAWLVSAGVPLTEVRDLLGHTTVIVTEKYAHLAPENVRAAVARLEDESRFGHAREFALIKEVS
ncbi:MAG: site-specific integrase [Gammaproteobacteria bacterium]|nr:site-specific integrase [Gammaproteobacteria bacterium]